MSETGSTTPQPPHSGGGKLPFAERLQRDVLVMDGAMGTQLYERGLAFKDCFDAANLERREWVLEVHRSYLEAGAQGIQTNTFGANRARLSKFRREGDQRAIVEAAIAIGKEAIHEHHYLIGSVGPLGVELEPLGPTSVAEATTLFRELIEVLEPGVDAFSLETFSSPTELLAAVRAVRAVSDKPILAQVSITNQGETLYGTRVETIGKLLDEEEVESIGLNCSTGPRAVLEAALRLMEVTDKPIGVRPNAGMPREIDGRVFYESTPDYFARFARRFLQAGGRLLGGCCGTTPDHVRGMVRAARAIGVQVRQSGRGPRASEVPVVRPLSPLPLAERSRFGAALAAGQVPVSIELLPPKTPNMSKVCEAARQIRDAGATLINVPDGPRASARISNIAACVILQNEVGIETLPHFCCRDRNLLGMQSDIMGAASLGIQNLLIITGDPPYQGNYPDVTAVFDVDAIGLCNVVDNLNHGLDLGGNEVGAQTHFCFGAALNPTSLDLERELSRYRWKVQAGIDFSITQPIFDVDGFLEWLPSLPVDGPPILAGIWPLRSLRNAEFLASEVPGVVVPKATLQRMREADAKGKAAEEGVRIAVEAVEALSGKVGGFQIAAPFNKPEAAIRVLQAAQAAKVGS